MNNRMSGQRNFAYASNCVMRALEGKKLSAVTHLALLGVKIAGTGIIVAVLNLVLKRAEREEQAMMTTLAGLIVVLMLIVEEIAGLFETVKTVFGL